MAQTLCVRRFQELSRIGTAGLNDSHSHGWCNSGVAVGRPMGRIEGGRVGNVDALNGFLVLLAVQALIESCYIQSKCAGKRLEIVGTQLLLVVEQQVVHFPVFALVAVSILWNHRAIPACFVRC